jgi:Protein of unknown function (DUF3024)
MPPLTRLQCERSLAAYCARICPPSARNAVNIGYQIEAQCVTLLEWRPICGVPGTRRGVPVAQMRWSSQDNLWRLYHRRATGRWRALVGGAPSRSFVDLLREIDADRSGTFWGRVDGKSLRWCSSKGRCTECDQKYCQALGKDQFRSGDSKHSS